eukprot:8199211-Pyramimonas_sp.AAC.1
MDPHLYQASQATSPFASPRPHVGQPAFPDQYAVQRTESLVGQQNNGCTGRCVKPLRVRRGGIDLPSANWTPPW